MAALLPTNLPTVPRVLNGSFGKITHGVAAAANKYGLENGGYLTDALWNLLVFTKLKPIICGNVRLMMNGSAPLSHEAKESMEITFCHQKKVEYEVVCDTKGTSITVCNMENFGPLGIHTGDSIIVTPSRTLSNNEYFRLCATAQKVVRYLNIVGECNIQYAVDPHSDHYCIIEVNTWLSRSSALASKAMGYPLAYVATKIALSIDLVNIKNSVTKTTTACFELSLDYCALARISTLQRAILHYSLATIDERVLRVLKVAAKWPGATELQVRARRKQLNVVPVVEQIDTLAAEFPVQTNYLCITAVHTIRVLGKPAIVVNGNPETGSTDYDESNRLYFEELTLERALAIYNREQPEGVNVSVGGLIPNNLAMPLHKAGVTILGTHPDKVKAINSLLAFSADVDHPVLARRSYVLSGAGVIVASDELQLREYLSRAPVAISCSVSISKFVLHAKEDNTIINYAISEHVENAGVHSGGAALVLPAWELYLMARDNDVKVIERKLRTSRTIPFISKTFYLNCINLAMKAMLGHPVKSAPPFSFTRLHGADPTLGVEMALTGDVAYFGTDMHETYLKALQSAGFKIPKKRKVLISIRNEHIKREFAKSADPEADRLQDLCDARGMS
ncbi:hypothetical protein PybrP1_002120 [[Pythium] brassicae (nom. inval.)]|nr:hypothetical protein PybrP1_002120 [[Pythium] brassicae (nom. inval.)]